MGGRWVDEMQNKAEALSTFKLLLVVVHTMLLEMLNVTLLLLFLSQRFCQELLEVLLEVPLQVPHKVLLKGLHYVLLKMILKTFQLESIMGLFSKWPWK